MINATYANTSLFTFKGQKKMCKVIRVTDGDTVYIAFEYGGGLVKAHCRLQGVDSPEHNLTPEIAIRSRNRLVQLVTDCEIDLDDPKKNIQALINTNTKLLEAEFFGKEKYGRELIKLFDLGIDIQIALIDEGFCKSYDGGKKPSWE